MGESKDRDGQAATTDTPTGNEAEFRYRGSRLGFPETGPGSVPGFGRRLIAVIIDWILANCLASLLFGTPVLGGSTTPAAGVTLWLPLFVFAVMTAALLVLFGTTVGKRLVGIRITATGERNWPWPVAWWSAPFCCAWRSPPSSTTATSAACTTGLREPSTSASEARKRQLALPEPGTPGSTSARKPWTKQDQRGRGRGIFGILTPLGIGPRGACIAGGSAFNR